jgi:hypothetical protein
MFRTVHFLRLIVTAVLLFLAYALISSFKTSLSLPHNFSRLLHEPTEEIIAANNEVLFYSISSIVILFIFFTIVIRFIGSFARNFRKANSKTVSYEEYVSKNKQDKYKI